MYNVSASLGWTCSRRSRSVRPRLGAIDPALVLLLCFTHWVASELSALRQERQAAIALNRDFHTRLAVRDPNLPWHERELSIDLRELRHGRFYVPVTDVYITSATIDHRAWKRLAAFRYLEGLQFQDCKLDGAAELAPTSSVYLKGLSFVRTPITTDCLRTVSRLQRP